MNQITKNDAQSMTQDIVKTNIDQLKNLFPEVFTEDRIDFEALQSLLGEYIDKEGERYSFNWKGKAKARRIAQTPSTATLRPSKEESKKWDKTKNLYIEGDNFEVLRLLQKSYHKKIDFIYIDPPYNTGTDLLYKNDFAEDLNNYLKYSKQIDDSGLKLSTNSETSGRYHSDWLSMIYSRLILARNLLNDEGIICVTIDDYEMPRLWLLMNEIFGEENHLGTVVIRNNPKGRMTNRKISLVHEYGLFFSKVNSGFIKKLEVKPEDKSHNYIMDKDGTWYLPVNLRKQGVDSSALNKKGILSERYFSIYFEPTTGEISVDKKLSKEITPIDSNGEKRIWRRSKEAINEMYKTGEIWAKETPNGYQLYYKFRGGLNGQQAKSIWYDSKFSASEYGTKEVDSLLQKRELFSYPKAPEAVKQSIKCATSSKDALILDFFSGSGTTAQAVMELNSEDNGNRKYIMIQLPEPTDVQSEAFKAGYKNLCEIGKERIRRAGDKIVKELIEKQSTEKLLKDDNQVNPEDLDIGFKVFKLDTSNIKTWDSSTENIQQALLDSVSNIKSERSQEDVLYEVLLKYGLDLTLPTEEFEQNGKKLYSVGFGSLVICLDNDIDISIAEKIVEIKDTKKPETMNVIFKDNGFKDDVVKTNTIQLLTKHGVESVRSI